MCKFSLWLMRGLRGGGPAQGGWHRSRIRLTHSVCRGLVWSHLIALDCTCSHMVAYGLTWSCPDSLVLTGIHLNLLGLNLALRHMVSHGRTLRSPRPPLVSACYSHGVPSLLFTLVLRCTTLKTHTMSRHLYYSNIELLHM